LGTPDGQEENRSSLFGEHLPELPPTERLAEIWLEMGRSSDGINGATPFSWAELQAFAAMSGRDLHPCEASCLVDMSRAYCIELAERSPLRKAPMERDL
jgi:hypothetical protein